MRVIDLAWRSATLFPHQSSGVGFACFRIPMLVCLRGSRLANLPLNGVLENSIGINHPMATRHQARRLQL